MADAYPSHLTDRTHNAGSAPMPSDLGMTRTEAQIRATALKIPVAIFKHVGGRHPVTQKVVQATGHFMWRDAVDADGRTVSIPPRHWEAVETVTPEVKQ